MANKKSGKKVAKKAAKKSVTKKTITKKKSVRKNAKNKVTYVAIVLDKSGSMSTVQKQALSGLNEQINTIKKNASKGGKTFVTLIEFNHAVTTVFDKTSAGELTEQVTYNPLGSTAMYDALGRAVTLLEEHGKDHDVKTNKAFLVIAISDGMENASTLWNQAVYTKKVKELEATGEWTFTYMLSNQDLNVAQRAFAATASNMATYSSTAIGTTDALLRTASATENYFGTRSKGAKLSLNFYNQADNTTPSDVDSTNSNKTAKI